MKLLLNSVVLGLSCASVFCANSQNTANTFAKGKTIPSYTLEFGGPQQTTLGGPGTAMSAIHACGEDGTVFLEVRDSRSDGFGLMALHSLDRSGQTIRFSPGRLPGYNEEISQPIRFFAGENRVVALVYATPLKATLSDPTPDEVKLALIYDRKGALLKAVRLPEDGLQVSTVGLYESGDLLVVGADNRDHSVRLLVVDETGDVIREIRLFDEDYNLRKNAKQDQLLSEFMQNKSGALGMLQIFPSGQDLLLLPTLTRQPIIEVNERGMVRVFPLQIPNGLFLGEPLSIAKQRWSFETFLNELTAPQGSGERSEAVALTSGPVTVFDPSDGSVVRKIYKREEDSGAVLVCEHDGEYTALTTDRTDGTLEVIKANIPR